MRIGGCKWHEFKIACFVDHVHISIQQGYAGIKWPSLIQPAISIKNNTVKVETQFFYTWEDQRKTCSLYAIFIRPIFEKNCEKCNCQEDIHVHNLVIIGKNILRNIVGKPTFDVLFKRQIRAKILANESIIKIRQRHLLQKWQSASISCDWTVYYHSIKKSYHIFKYTN